MSRLVLYMSMSLDGFIAGPDDDKQNGLGIGGHRLHDWLRQRATRQDTSGSSPTASNRASRRLKPPPAIAT